MVLCNYIGIYPGIYVCLQLRQTGEGIVKVRFRLTFDIFYYRYLKTIIKL